jgi:hypothetical protein
MKKFVVFITTILIITPLAMLFYKSQVLNLSLLPQMVDDVWNFHLTAKPKGDQISFSFPIPKPGTGIKITDERIRSKNFEVFIDSNSDSALATWTAKEPIKQKVAYSARIDLKPILYKDIAKDFTETYPKGLNRYLKLPELLPEDNAAIAHLESAILEGSVDKTGVIR